MITYYKDSQNTQKSVTGTVTVYFKEKKEIKISQGLQHIEYTPGRDPNAELPLSSPHGGRVSITFLALLHDNTYRLCPPGKLICTCCPEFVLGSVVLALLTGLIDDLSPSGGQADMS